MDYGNKNKQQLDEHVSPMEAQFSDHFVALDDQLAELKQSVDELPVLKSSVDQLKEEFTAMRQVFTDLQGMMQQLLYVRENDGAEGSNSKHKRSNRSGDNNHKEYFQYTNGNLFPKLPKVEFPKFCGEDSYGWVRKAKRYVEFHPMDEAYKVNFASVHFEGQAEHWFGTYIKAKGRVHWGEFVRDLNSRFAKLFKESVIGEFHKLRQLGSVELYYNEFETLRSVLVNEGCRFDEVYYVQSFVSGLRDEIRLEIEKFELNGLSRAIYLARKQETALSSNWHQPRSNQRSNQHTSYTTPVTNKTFPSQLPAKPKPNFLTPAQPTNQLPAQNTTKALLPTPNNSPYHKLSSAYFDDRRKRVQCYWCEETFTPAHNCKQKQVSMLIVEEGDEEDPPPIYDEEVQGTEEQHQASPITEEQNDMVITINTMTVVIEITTQKGLKKDCGDPAWGVKRLKCGPLVIQVSGL
ncbi:hypothetical protein RJ640_025097 [Escallonia rubra]|uniref:Ty3 transposon capsid-like protein domain-containing protein n=1 Tax=Escallonia rubra TaxID=112253 RepID=A0AA88R7R7_9ASTE|nr:hypothetical protein RJ640_025097 [Escallonia rubra]